MNSVSTFDSELLGDAALGSGNAANSGPAIDAPAMRATPDAAITEGGGTPSGGGSGGIPAQPSEQEREQADRNALGKVFDDLDAHLGPPGPSDPNGGTPDYRTKTIRDLDLLLRRTGEALVPGTETGARFGADELLHRALDVPSSEPLPPDVATQILQRITGLADPYEIFRVLQQHATLPEGTPASLYSHNPDELDPLVQATLEALLAPDSPAQNSPTLAPATPEGLTEATSPVIQAIKFSLSMRKLVTSVRRYFSTTFTGFRPHTQDEGYMAQTIIGMHYVVSHPGNLVVLDTYAIPSTITGIWQGITTLASAAASGGPFAAVYALLSAATGTAARPDILDLKTREVYEIKPFKKMAEGLSQLAKVIYQLNKAQYGETAARALLASIAADGSTSGWSPPTNERPYLPGTTWVPSQIYPLPDGRFMYVLRAAPGVIGYQILGKVDVEADGPTAGALLMWWAMAALVAFATRALLSKPGKSSAGSGQPLPPRQIPVDVDALVKAILSTAAVAEAAGLAFQTTQQTLTLMELIDLLWLLAFP